MAAGRRDTRFDEGDGMKPAISQRAHEYVLSLGRDRVTSRQKHVLMAIATNYSDRFGEAVMDLDTLCEYILVTRRRMRDILSALDPLIEYLPGLGAGNFGRFRFREFDTQKEAEKGKERGGKGEVFDTPNKEEDQNLNLSQNQNAGAGFDSLPSSANNQQTDFPTSSSEVTQRDDDVGNLSPFDRALKDCAAGNAPPADVDRVIQAFEKSPVTTGRAKLADLTTARGLLKFASVEQIEYAILLASARRVNSFYTHNDLGQEKSQAKVQALAYFSNAVEEVAGAREGIFTASYAQYLRHTLRKFTELKKEPQRVAG